MCSKFTGYRPIEQQGSRVLQRHSGEGFWLSRTPNEHKPRDTGSALQHFYCYYPALIKDIPILFSMFEHINVILVTMRIDSQALPLWVELTLSYDLIIPVEIEGVFFVVNLSPLITCSHIQGASVHTWKIPGSFF